TNEIGHTDDNYFLAMEYLDGQPLHQVHRRALPKGGLPLKLMLRIVIDTLAGLHHAHELRDYDGTPLNVVHRDATPQNIFVTYDGHVKVVDFGIAKAERRTSKTETGVIKGKVAYLAPEQIAGDVDRRSDVFAIGVVLWEGLVGRRMWGDIDHLLIMHKVLAGEIPSSPREVKPEIDEELDRICRKALAPRPEDRYPTALAFHQDLDRYATSKDLRASSLEVGELVTGLFEDKRAAATALLEKQLAHLRHSPTKELPVANWDLSPTEGSGRRPLPALPDDGTPIITSGAFSAQQVSTSASTALRRKRTAMGLAAALAVALIPVAIYGSKRTAAPTVAATPPAVAAVVSDAGRADPASATTTAMSPAETAPTASGLAATPVSSGGVRGQKQVGARVQLAKSAEAVGQTPSSSARVRPDIGY
ncbi:MAG: serine/threonine protein kinase, partial [Gemmatimonadetes bacterium]|nr:serine/threonine protein kinase [Gemmatimonadota bacterium]